MSEVRTKNLTVRVEGTKATVVERRRKVGHETLACEYVCGLLDTDTDTEGRCWSYDHAGPRCPVVARPDTADGGGEA